MLTALLVFVLVLLGLLAIPIDLVYRIHWHGRVQGEMHVHWLFGLLRVRIPVESKQPSSTARETHTKHAQHKTKSRRRGNPLVALRIRAFRQRILKLLHDLWHAIHKREMQVQLQIGLDDPADTGQLWAVMGPLSAVLAQSRDVQIDIAPDFSESHFEFNSSGDIRIIPLQFIAIAVALLLSPAFWQGMQHMRSAR